MPYKWNRMLLQEHFDLSDQELELFILLGLLQPDHYPGGNPGILDNSKDWTWDDDEVQRFQKIINSIRDKHLHFYRLVSSRFIQFEQSMNERLQLMDGHLLSLSNDFRGLISKLERQETMIDSKYFCEITGYAEQTFRNAVRKTDDSGLEMRLDIDFYKDLIWHKIKGRWYTPLQDFLQLRANFNYELILSEKKRRGEFVPRANGKIKST